MLNSTVGHITGQFDVLKSFLQLDEKSERKEEKQVYIFLLQFFFKLSRMHEHNYIMIRLIIVTQDRGYINKKKKTCQKLFKQILGLSHQEYHRMVNLKQVCKPYGASIGDFLMFMQRTVQQQYGQIIKQLLRIKIQYILIYLL
ncbi:unnamed protein product [Paramecium primaurelia]|uniref:Uncharacterized protein n=1 Tax=Paramecium primaurelia TaxID=5886 RepID=A0A8S1MEE6_PARPR|nr:unnamed protein product [Paramecium primaurelia]